MRKPQRERLELVLEWGGKCQLCGYSRCTRALQFHHKDASEKYEWGKDGRASVAEIRAHPERFELLCANCHIEHHDRENRTRERLQVACEYCGKLRDVTPFQVRDGRVRFCSYACKNAARHEAAPATLEERFWKYVRKTDTCWEWTGATTRGTGILSFQNPNGKHAPRSVNRVSWSIHHGPAAANVQIRHSCGNSLCVNPEHLYLSSKL